MFSRSSCTTCAAPIWTATWSAPAISKLPASPLINALFSEVNPIPVKEALAQMGMIEANYRMPLCPMADNTRAALTDALKGAGLLD